MSERTPFEARLTDAFNRYADQASVAVEPSIARRAIASGGRRGAWRLSWLPSRPPSSRVQGRLALLGIAAVVTVLVGSMAFLSIRRPAVADPAVGASLAPSPDASPAGSPSQSPPNAAGGTFTLTGSMGVEREHPTATLLRDGRVLVAGGYGLEASRTSEVFDPVTGLFTPSGNLLDARYDASAVLLADGRVLIVGGMDTKATSPDGTVFAVDVAEVWDPATNLFTPAGSLREARTTPFLRPLADGRVVVSGGFTWNGTDSRPSATAELWDPLTKAFDNTAPDPNPPVDPSQVAALADGRSLVLDDSGARVWDPTTKTFSATGSPLSFRDAWALTVTQLVDGRVLVVGGGTRTSPGEGQPLGPAQPVAEIWDPTTGRFLLTASSIEPRRQHSAVRLADGRVLIVGNNLSSGAMTSAEIFDPG